MEDTTRVTENEQKNLIIEAMALKIATLKDEVASWKGSYKTMKWQNETLNEKFTEYKNK